MKKKILNITDKLKSFFDQSEPQSEETCSIFTVSNTNTSNNQENGTKSPYNSQTTQGECVTRSDEMSKDLMIMIADAIAQWQRKYHMESVPKHIIFKQAFSLINDWEKIVTK